MATRAERPDATTPRDKVLGYVTLTLRIFDSESVDCPHASECVELGIASCGATIDEALANIQEATVQYLNAIEGNGEIIRIFRKRGIPIFLGEPREQAINVMAHPQELVQIFVYQMLVDVHDGVLNAPGHAAIASM